MRAASVENIFSKKVVFRILQTIYSKWITMNKKLKNLIKRNRVFIDLLLRILNLIATFFN